MNHLEKVGILAHDICKTPDATSVEACHESFGRSNPLCNENGACRILEKSPEQIKYVLSSNEANVFLKACPGSGKTEVVGLKAAYTIRNWQRRPGGMAVLTFTNNAADIIHRRVSQFTGVDTTGYPHFIGTIDSWLHGYVAHPFAHLETGYQGEEGDRSIRIVENSSTAGFLNAYKTMHVLGRMGSPTANQYYLNTDSAAERFVFSPDNQGAATTWNRLSLSNSEIDDLRRIKKSFWNSGFATYQDVEYLCHKMLAGNETLCSLLAHRFLFIIVDECQDLSWIQLQILDLLRRQGTVLHFVGDLNQAIYEFKRVDPQQVSDFTKTHGFTPYSLSNNYRSCQPIVDTCHMIVKSSAPEHSMCTPSAGTSCVCVPYTEAQMPLLPRWFATQCKHASCDIDQSAVVARNWNNVSRMRPSSHWRVRGPQMTLAMSICLWQSRAHQAIEDAIGYMGRFVSDKYFAGHSSNHRYHHCPGCLHSYLRWRLFLAKVLDSCSASGSSMSNLDQLWSDWVQYVRSQFGEIAREHRRVIEHDAAGTIPEFPDLAGNTFRTPPKDGAKNVRATLPNSPTHDYEDRMRITTIHSVKGETLDAVLLVSAPGKQGTLDGHWTQWLEDSTTEAARLAYVASSRPRHLLAWAVPKPLGKADEETIRKLGFDTVELTV